MRNSTFWSICLLAGLVWSCAPASTEEKGADTATEQDSAEMAEENSGFKYLTEQFADLKIIRYQVPGFDQLSLDQKKLVYYLSQAALSGRDIIYDQNYRHNLTIRKALENVVNNYQGDKTTPDWESFMVYTKRVWFSNGIHHHYSTAKLKPDFSQAYFEGLLTETKTELDAEALKAIFDSEVDAKRVNKNPEIDLIAGSANNFYESGVTAEEVDNYYQGIIDKNDPNPISYGLNTTVMRDGDGLKEVVWKVDGKYGPAIDKIVFWLEKAVTVAENDQQKAALELLIKYYQTGDLKVWDEYNIAWVAATEGDIDYINGFIEVYGDAKGFKASYESVVQIKDFEASARMEKMDQNVQWFEDNSPIMDEHKKAEVKGVTYKVVTVAMESGDASPSTPIGINLPNANWIRTDYGSKSVSLGNIVNAYSNSSGSGYTDEFAYSEEEKARSKEHGELGSKLHTALHEVVGHASGKLNEGVGTPKETLKNYASTLEEGRADLVALYYIMDQKMIDLGLMPSLEVGKAEYDGYIRNGLMVQLRRLEPGELIEEDHMRNRQLVAGWAYEKGKADNVIERIDENGKTYFRINDYEKLRDLFGQLLREIQRIKSEGDYEAGKALVENYGVQVDQELHAQVLERAEKLGIAPYGGFINPSYEVVEENGEIVDIKVMYPEDFTEQMLGYGRAYSFL